MKLNLGCGGKHLEGFTNVDIQQPADVIANVSSLPFKDNTVSEIFASHILEHFWYDEISKVLCEWIRVLKPGGFIKIATPDAEKLFLGWQSKKWDWYWVSRNIVGAHTKYNEGHKSLLCISFLFNMLDEVRFVNHEILDSRGPSELYIKSYKAK